MLDRSAGSAYADQARAVAAVLERVDSSPVTAARPEAVARTIVRAATTPRPRPRYAAGRGAGTILRTRHLLPDRAFDALVRRVYGP
ncbi:hypothetical protein GCM10027194_27150 [Thalassiella azotivora]